ncbi:adenylate/guanylate cyclase protein (plasmid) [Rhizobium gallicum bv. gallicum R602sp]|uniref:Adenylate/guanylate cyclase protein n=1 Tax=Rhizobium gallicum bv. gallicum R602sp TaxID=1041138 RepID=A0A0B4XIH0_9HYPH|nr:AAA family ATPase [Rhizobium gallicum]AJD46373.1 adenylate/guanylate cyclase protein [Rhizobium gallicum bv. gallicum R602sp]
MQVGSWLRDQGLEQYEEAFRQNDIDPEILRDLTAEDLIGLGVISVGHRRRLLAAIAALRETVRQSPRPGDTSAATGAERRQLTVMFVDLVESTALSLRLDPEEMSELLRHYQGAVAGAIARFEGHVAKYMGDGVLAYFGYPRAHEDEAERAVRAGLAAVEAVRDLRPPHGGALQARVGIATGLVVVGELVGEGAAREETVVGDTPNLAARLQSLAEPGTVVVAFRTRQLIGALFDLVELCFEPLKGFPGSVRAWRVLGESAAESRFEALHGSALTPLVGRDHEIGLLLKYWEAIKEGEGQVVLLAGEPGIGKSRLVRALRRRLESEPHMAVSHYCSPYYQSSPLHPVIGLLERAAGFAAGDAAEARLSKLEGLLALSTEDVAGVAPLLAALLSIPAGDRYRPLELSPHLQKEQTLEVLVDQLMGLAAHQPVLAVYEDVHWADPTSLELLDLVIDRVQGSRVLVLITFRPEFLPPWLRHAHVTAMTLSRLSRRQGTAMVERLTGGRELPAEVRDDIVAKTDGVPLFVEELTRAVIETNLLKDEGDHYTLANPLSAIPIPATLQESLLARLDRLASARDVAQLAAAIGREFSHELLVAAAALPKGEVEDALAALITSGLVFRHAISPQVTYSFKHALVRDAAYATLVRTKRLRLHAAIARAIEHRFPETVQGQPELLARHYSEAGQPALAINYWLRAGQAEIARSATAEAITHLTRGLELLESLPDDAARWRQELELQVALGVALMISKGWAAPEVGRTNARARELCERLGGSNRLLPVLYGDWVFHVVRAELEAGRKAGEDLLRRAREEVDVSAETVGNRIVGTDAFLRGELIIARKYLERSLALYDPQQHRSLAFLFAQDPRVSGMSVLSWTLFTLGYPERAQTRSNQALTDAAELSHRNTLGYALLYGCILSQLRGDRREARERADSLITLARAQGSPHFLGAGMVIRGWTLGETGELQAAITQVQEGLGSWQATGARFLVPFFLSCLAYLETQAGRAKTGLDLLSDALDRVRGTGERWFEAELHRLTGELMLQLPMADRAGVEARLRHAIEVARAQHADLWELRAATSLGRLQIAQGRGDEAHDLLAPVYGKFIEGFATSDLQSAQRVLCEADGCRG